MDLGIAGQVAIVTGAAQGIGRVIALTFAQEGSHVVIADINEEKARGVAEEVKRLGVEALALKGDVSSWPQVEEMARTVQARFGKIDCLVNNAAVWFDSLFIQSKPEQWEAPIRVNYVGTLNCSRAVLEGMVQNHRGSIISINSDAGRIGQTREAAYSGTKGAIIAFSKALAQEVGRYGVRVNVVSPGVIRAEPIPTDPDDRTRNTLRVYPMRKFGTPQDVADMTVFLASDRAGDITGQTISVS